MLLSILICTIPQRADLLACMMDSLRPQLTPEVEILVNSDECRKTIGHKRNELVAMAAGSFLCHVDDDDTVSPDFVSSIVEALKEAPDCVGYIGNFYRDGKFNRQIVFRKGNKHTDGVYRGKKVALRPIMHLQPVRTELARQVPFVLTNFGEDADYAKRLAPLLTSEVFIDKPLYHYWFRDTKPELPVPQL